MTRNGLSLCFLFVIFFAQPSRSFNVTCPSPPTNNDTYPLTAGNLEKDGYYFAARINSQDSEFIDIQLSGKAIGWVAIGFSTTRTMSAADVFGCKKDSSTDAVYAIDTWNPAQKYAPNVIDNTQIGMCTHYTEYINGYIHCTFSRYIKVVNMGQDLNLNQTLYRIYSAISDRGGPRLEHLHKHSKIPSITKTKSNIIFDIENEHSDILSSWPRVIFIKLHGCSMIISWILLATSGIFFASWMKPVLPNGEWFQVHRGLMIGSLLVGALGFVFAFIANAKGTTTPGLIDFYGIATVHFVIGVIVMSLQIVNPIIAIFRCEPDTQRRCVFNLLHGHLIGYSTLILAFTNIGIGIYIFRKELLVGYIVIAAFLLAFQFGLFIVFTINAFTSPGGDTMSLVHSLLKYWYYLKKDAMLKEMLMKSPIAAGKDDEKLQLTEDSSGTDETKKSEKKQPIKGSLIKLSWSAFGIQLALTVMAALFFTIYIATK